MRALEPKTLHFYLRMGDLFYMQTSSSVRQKDANPLMIPSTITHHDSQHHQISPTIFVCVPNHHTTSNNQSHTNSEIIDISEQEEDENTCKNGTSIDDSSDEEEIEVIQLSDDDDESSGKNTTSSLNKHKINESSMNDKFDLTHKTIQQQKSFDPSVPSTSQTEQQPEFQSEKEADNANKTISPGRVCITLGLCCSECSVLIESRSKLEQHLKDEHGKPPFKCMVRGCNGQFKDKLLLNAHHKDHGTKWICPAVDCHFERSTEQSLRQHVYQNHEIGLFQCAVCLVTYSRRMKVYTHHTLAHKHPRNRAQRLFSCPVVSCTFIGNNGGHLKRHYQFKHTLVKRPFRCTWLNCGFSRLFVQDQMT